MSESTINAKTKDKEAKNEKEDSKMILNFGVFFDDTSSRGKAYQLSNLYKQGYKKENERAYVIAKSIKTPDFLYVWKDDTLIIDFQDIKDQKAWAAMAVNDALMAIWGILISYLHYDELEIRFDIYGIDSGMICAYLMAHIIEPENDGLDPKDKQIMMAELDSFYTRELHNLKREKYVNHFTILNTVYATRFKEEIESEQHLETTESDGYTFKMGVTYLDNNTSKTEIRKQGFTKEDLNNCLDELQNQLDYYGMIDIYGVGMVSDAVNAIISVGRGKWGDAGLSLLAVLPFVGNYFTGVKMTKKANSTFKIIKGGDKATIISKGVEAANEVVDLAKYRWQKKKIAYKTKKIKKEIKTGTDGTTIVIYNSLDGIGPVENIPGLGVKMPSSGGAGSNKPYFNSIFDSKYAKKGEKANKVVPIEAFRENNVGLQLQELIGQVRAYLKIKEIKEIAIFKKYFGWMIK